MKTDLITARSNPGLRRAFSLLEMVVASGISTMVFTVGALSYQAITAQQRIGVTYGSVTIGGAAAENFYGKPEGVTEIDAYFAPNYGRATTADLMRDTFYEDLGQASAVFCLGREGLSTARPSQVNIPVANDGKMIDTPEAFRIALESSEPLLAGIHTSAGNDTSKGAINSQNLSVYMLLPARSNRPNRQIVLSIWEIDIQNITIAPRGTYATIRRYSLSYLTNVYDVFYPDNLGATFTPLAVCLERDVRILPGNNNDDGYDKFRIAKQEPFYFMWWPDPASAEIDGDSLKVQPAGGSDLGATYYQMGGRTSYMFTFPMFPTM